MVETVTVEPATPSFHLKCAAPGTNAAYGTRPRLVLNARMECSVYGTKLAYGVRCLVLMPRMVSAANGNARAGLLPFTLTLRLFALRNQTPKSNANSVLPRLHS
eukprot:2095876-Rhodomonas_salina.1